MENRENLEQTLERLALISYAVDELIDSYEVPSDPEDRADLLLAAEDMAASVVLLMRQINVEVWGTEKRPNEDDATATPPTFHTPTPPQEPETDPEL